MMHHNFEDYINISNGRRWGYGKETVVWQGK